MWREFNAMNPHNIPQHEEHEIPIEKPKSKKRTAPKKEKKVAPLRIKLPKKTKKKVEFFIEYKLYCIATVYRI